MLPTVDKQLLFDHFADKTTPLQKRLIEEWLHAEANQELFFASLMEWESRSAPYLPALEDPLLRFVEHMDASPAMPLIAELESTTSQTRPLRSVWTQWSWLAAACMLAGILFWGWQNRDAMRYQTYQTGYKEIQSVQLSDGSQVDLQASSTLRIPRFGFGKRTREVWLKGEASFTVTHTPENLKFLVKTDRGFDVVVHGTEFTVNTRSYRANVMLRKGKVQVNYRDGKARQEIILKPGDLVALGQPDHPQILHRVQPQAYNQWKEHRFIFDNMPLRDFGQMMSENYGLTVDIPNQAVAERTLAGSFRADNVDELLQIVAELFNLQVTRQGNTVQLTESIN